SLVGEGLARCVGRFTPGQFCSRFKDLVMVTLSEMATRVRETCSVSASYDAAITQVVEGAMKRLLRDYNFPKQARLNTFPAVAQGTNTFDLPEGFKKPIS